MRRNSKLFVILLTVTFSTFNFANRALFQTVNATYVEGPITQDTIWTLVESPFVLSKDIVVYPNVTLTIEPGVKVKFGGEFSLIILGRLYANGTDKQITFTSNREQPVEGDWIAIKFNGAEKSILIGCLITHAEDGMFIESGIVEIENSTISHCSQNGITVKSGSINVKDCTVRLCSGSGINATDSAVTVKNSVIMENGNGLCVTGNGLIDVQKNIVIGNEGNGLLLTGNETSGVNISQNIISSNNNGIKIDAISHHGIVIIHNNVSSNLGNGFYISSLASTSITNNSVSYNNVGFFYDQGNHAAHYNDIYGNEMGMDVTLNATVNAEQNYWGDPSGPYHELLNPAGKGDSVGGNGVNLDFIFYLTKPVGYTNAPPTAILLTDKTLISPNGTVMFIATNSVDDGRIDWYNINFGDGSESGWTTVSIFTHKYSFSGIYNARVKVMDDFGAVNTSELVTINVAQGLSPLYVNIVNMSSCTTIEEIEEVSIIVYVTNERGAPIQDATVTMFSVKGGSFTQNSGLTDANGYFATNFTLPDVTQITNVRIIVRASKSGCVDGSDYKYFEVLPFLSVQVTTSPNVILSEETADITIDVKSNEQPVPNANVTISSDGGTLSTETGTTDSNGILILDFFAPQTTTRRSITITARATKGEYMDGMGQAVITIEPKILTIQIVAEPNVTISEAKLNVTVHVEYATIPIMGANVTVMAEYGNFSETTGLTDTNGYVKFIFIAPAVNSSSSINIIALATKDGYAENRSQLEITVNPRTFNIQINAPSVESEGATTITIYLACKEDATPVAGANVTISSTDGNFPVVTKITDTTGYCAFVFNAPSTTTQLSITITADVTKNGYKDGGSQTIVTVTPKISGGGWSLVTILLIIVPIAIVVILVVLVKLKVIIVSSEEE